MIDPGLLTEAKQLAFAVAPELSERPLYLLDMLELQGLPCTGGCYGWAMNSTFMELPIADRLGDRYAGPGPIVALDGERIAADCPPENFANCIRQVMLHEAAHLFPIRAMQEPADNQLVRVLQVHQMETTYLKEPPAGDEDDVHDCRFIRRVCHLLFRSKLLAAFVPTPDIHSGHRPITPIEFFLYELLPECVAMQNATMAAIEATPAPASFMEIWQGDLDYINRQRRQQGNNYVSI